MKLIGKGTFSKVYLKGNDEVLIVSRDKVKQAMSEMHWPSSRLFPRIRKEGEGQNGTSLYTSKYYPRVRNLKNSLEPKEWELYRYLQDLDRWPSRADMSKGNRWRSLFSSIPWRGKREALLAALDCLRMYGDDVCFEISPRNVAVHRGKLVLLDCFFFYSQLWR